MTPRTPYTGVVHTLDALVEHVKLQGHSLHYEVLEMAPDDFLVTLTLALDGEPATTVNTRLRAKDREDLILKVWAQLERVRTNLLSSMLGPVERFPPVLPSPYG